MSAKNATAAATYKMSITFSPFREHAGEQRDRFEHRPIIECHGTFAVLRTPRLCPENSDAAGSANDAIPAGVGSA